MSRSALWRQEANVQGRERQATDAFFQAVQEGKNNRTKGLVPLHGSEDTFNMNPVLLKAIYTSSYFQKTCLQEIQDWNSLVDEIYYQVKHLEPYSLATIRSLRHIIMGVTKSPSTAFCLLLRLFTLRCSEKQMKLMLDHVDSPYIRCTGFLYLRYACQPSLLWDWCEPYLYDEEEVQVQANSAKSTTTIGDFVRSLLEDMNYQGNTLLPRLPVAVERDVKVKLLQAQQIESRAVQHAKSSRTMQYFQTLGNRVRALYGDEENPITWYDAVVDRVITVDEETREPLSRPKFVVTFPEYGNTETVSLGEMDMPGGPGVSSGAGNRPDRQYAERGYRGGRDERRGAYDSQGHHDRDRGYDGDRHRGGGHYRRDDRRWERDRGQKRSHSRDRGDARASTETDLMEEVRRQEREKILSKGKSYASRPPSTRASLMGGGGGGGESLRDDDWSAATRGHPPRRSSPPLAPQGDDGRKQEDARKKRCPEEIAAIQEKKRKLMAKYG